MILNDTINFDPTATISGSWVITAHVVTTTGGTSSITTPTIPTATLPSANVVSYNSSTGQLHMTGGDADYPPGSAVVFTAVCTRTSDGAVGTTLLNVTIPLTDIVPWYVSPDSSVLEDLSQMNSGIYTYNVGDNISLTAGSQYITFAAVPTQAGYSINPAFTTNTSIATWNSANSSIVIATNANLGGSGPVTLEFILSYTTAANLNVMPLGITYSGNDEIKVIIVQNV